MCVSFLGLHHQNSLSPFFRVSDWRIDFEREKEGRGAKREREREREMEKVVVIDCRDHMLGRLASIIAKQILSGQKVVAVRTEGIVLSGGLVRQKMKYHRFLHKHTLSNPKHGPFHYRSPSRQLWRTVRGMVPHKTVRGTHAMERLLTFEGIPAPYDKMKRMVVPDALKVMRLQPHHKSVVLGQLATECGWKHGETIKEMEAARKIESKKFYDAKMKKVKVWKTETYIHTYTQSHEESESLPFQGRKITKKKMESRDRAVMIVVAAAVEMLFQYERERET